MPKEGLSVYLTAVDQMSPVFSSITDKTKVLDKETQSLALAYQNLQKSNGPLVQQQTELKASLEKQKLTVSELRKEYQKYGDDMSGLKMQLAIEEQETLKEKLKDVEDQLKLNRKSFNEQREEIRKGELEITGGGLSSDNKWASLLSGLEVDKKLSSFLQKAGGVFLTSALGSDMGGMISGALSGAVSGFLRAKALPLLGDPQRGRPTCAPTHPGCRLPPHTPCPGT